LYDPYGSTDLLLPCGNSPVNKKPQKLLLFEGMQLYSKITNWSIFQIQNRCVFYFLQPLILLIFFNHFSVIFTFGFFVTFFTEGFRAALALAGAFRTGGFLIFSTLFCSSAFAVMSVSESAVATVVAVD
jgi:hypothetical protein